VKACGDILRCDEAKCRTCSTIKLLFIPVRGDSVDIIENSRRNVPVLQLSHRLCPAPSLPIDIGLALRVKCGHSIGDHTHTQASGSKFATSRSLFSIARRSSLTEHTAVKLHPSHGSHQGQGRVGRVVSSVLRAGLRRQVQ